MLICSPRNTGPLPPLSWNGKTKVIPNSYFVLLYSILYPVCSCRILNKQQSRNTLFTARSVADPDPGSSDFFTSASGIRIRDPGWKTNLDPGSGINIPNHFPESSETVFWVKNTLCGSGIRNLFDPGSGINILNPQN
jgi:hypothetical protein